MQFPEKTKSTMYINKIEKKKIVLIAWLFIKNNKEKKIVYASIFQKRKKENFVTHW